MGQFQAKLSLLWPPCELLLLCVCCFSLSLSLPLQTRRARSYNEQRQKRGILAASSLLVFWILCQFESHQTNKSLRAEQRVCCCERRSSCRCRRRPAGCCHCRRRCCHTRGDTLRPARRKHSAAGPAPHKTIPRITLRFRNCLLHSPPLPSSWRRLFAKRSGRVIQLVADGDAGAHTPDTHAQQALLQVRGNRLLVGRRSAETRHSTCRLFPLERQPDRYISVSCLFGKKAVGCCCLLLCCLAGAAKALSLSPPKHKGARDFCRRDNLSELRRHAVAHSTGGG